MGAVRAARRTSPAHPHGSRPARRRFTLPDVVGPCDGGEVHWYGDQGMVLTRLVVTRGRAVVYVIAFVVAIRQWPALVGDRGLLPVSRWLRRTTWRHSPTLLRLR